MKEKNIDKIEIKKFLLSSFSNSLSNKQSLKNIHATSKTVQTRQKEEKKFNTKAKSVK